MLGFLTRKQRYLQQRIDAYLDQWVACVNAFSGAWDTYVAEGLGDAFDFRVRQTHKEESRADDLRREVEIELYGKALLPEGRGDVLRVLEAVDRLLSDAEWVLYDLQLQELKIPPAFLPSFERLVKLISESCLILADAIRELFVGHGGVDKIQALTDRVDEMESESDHAERTLIHDIFRAKDLDTGDKLVLKNLVLLLGRVADRAEHVSTRVTVVSVKRRI